MDSQLDWGARGDLENRRDVILRALSIVLRQYDEPQSFRMKDLADYLGIVKGNLYYYFKTKSDLMYHCRIKCLEQSLQALKDVTGKDESVGVSLHSLLREHILILIEGPYNAVLTLDMGSISAARRRRYVALRDEFEAGVRGFIKQGIKSGEFVEQDVSMASFAILGAINWIPKWYKRGGALTGREIAEYQASFFIRALRSDKALRSGQFPHDAFSGSGEMVRSIASGRRASR